MTKSVLPISLMNPLSFRKGTPGPYSHDLTMNVFKAGGSFPIAQYAEEKQTILSLVAAGPGVALVPSSYKNMNADGLNILPSHRKRVLKGFIECYLASWKYKCLC